MLSMYIAEKLMSEGYRLDRSLLLMKAIMHDVDETVTGDIAMPVKYYSAELRGLIGEMESKQTLSMIMKIFPDDVESQAVMFSMWENSKKGPEGAVVALCDALAVVYKIRDEVMTRGNKSVAHIVEHIPETISRKCNEIRNAIGAYPMFIESIELDCEIIVSVILAEAAK